jgi:hypothetical protein
MASNVAVTFLTALIVTWHVGANPVHAPDQPIKFESTPAAAVKVTTVSAVTSAEHTEPQFMPAGLLVTVPMPVPALVTVSGNVNVADTFFAPSIVTVHDPVPLHAPDQPANEAPVSGVAISWTEPGGKFAVHVTPQ